MPDAEKREKAIRGLKLCAYDPDPGQELKEVRSCPECPYYRAGCSPQLIRDALALLKEQEAVEPKMFTPENKTIWSSWYICGACERPVDPGDKFCRECGRELKWNE